MESRNAALTHPGPKEIGTKKLAVETQGLTKAFGERVVVDNLNLRIPASGVAAFVGPNGAGKSTTLRMLLGLLYPTSGTGWVLNGSIEHPESYLHRVGALIEGPAFYPALSGRANLEVLCALGNIPTRNIPDILNLVGLDRRGDDKVSKYSLGMKQRLGVAAALLPEPQLLVLDEPANGLDPTGVAAMRSLLRAVADAGMTVLVSSHQLAELQQIADWALLINRGKLRYQGTMAALLRERGKLVVKPEHAADLERLASTLKGAGFEPIELADGRVAVDGGQGAAPLINRTAMKAGITLCELRTGQSSLEEAYFTMTEGGSIV